MAETETTTTTEAPAAPAAKLGVSNWMTSLQSVSTPAEPAQGVGKSAEKPTPSPEPPPAPARPATPAAPAAQPSAPAESTPPAEGEEKWPRTAQEWKKFKEARKERETVLTKELETHKARLAEYESRGSTPEQTQAAEQLKKENEELSKRLQIVDVTRHPKFEAYFNGKSSAQFELAKRIVGPTLAPRVEALLKSPPSELKTQQLDELFFELTPAQQSRLGGVVNSLDGIEAEREQEIAKASENYQQMVARQNEAKAQVAKEFDSLFERISKEAGDPKEGIAPYQKKDGDQVWNAAVAKRIAYAKNLMSGQGVSQEEVVRASLHAAAIPAILQHNLDLQAEITKLQAQVQSLSNATPRVEAAKPGANNGQTAPQVKAGSRPMDVMKGWVKGFGETMNAPRE